MNFSNIFRLLTIVTIAITCIIIALSAWLIIDITQRAERVFGPASDNLNFTQRVQYSYRLLNQRDELERPSKPTGDKFEFTIQPGESIRSITTRLEQAQLITSASALRDFLIYAGLDTTIQSGTFQINPSMNCVQIALSLQDATPEEINFRILPGWRLEEIAQAIPTSGLEFSPNLFLSNAYKPPKSLQILEHLPEDASLEGFLFPDSYRLHRETSIQAFLETILADFEIKVDHQMRSNFNGQGLTLFQAVTLASIIQREAVIEDEMPMIASVFLNRLSNGMKLETDPTVQYALGLDIDSNSWWKNPLSLDDLQVDSLFNTYFYPGLPPGPIANPGLSALSAVAYPAQTPYFYFRSACDGSGKHSFAQTFEQHQRNACP